MEKKRPIDIKLSMNINGCAIESSGIRILAVTKVMKEIKHARIKPPRPKAANSCVFDTGDDRWSSIARWSFCCTREDELLSNILRAKVIIIRPGMINNM